MKKLIFRLMMTLVTVVLITVVLSAVYMKSLEKYALDSSGMPEVITVANTGNSHGLHAFDYSSLPGGFNFALGSQPLQYDASLIERYIDRFSEDATLFIPLSYMSFWGDPTEDEQYEALAMRYMGLLDADGLVLKNKTDYFILKYFSVIRWGDVQTHSIFAQKSDRVVNASESGLSLEELGARRAAYHAALAVQDGELLPMHEPSLDSVRKMVALCRENGVTPVFITTPYTRAYSGGMPEMLLKSFYEAVNSLSEELSVPYFDYSRDSRFADSMFEDSDHLNAQGAALFMQIVSEEILSK